MWLNYRLYWVSVKNSTLKYYQRYEPGWKKDLSFFSPFAETVIVKWFLHPEPVVSLIKPFFFLFLSRPYRYGSYLFVSRFTHRVHYGYKHLWFGCWYQLRVRYNISLGTLWFGVCSGRMRYVNIYIDIWDWVHYDLNYGRY